MTSKLASTVEDPRLKMKLRACRYFFGGLITIIAATALGETNPKYMFYKALIILLLSVGTHVVETLGIYFGIKPDELKEEDK